MILLIPASAIYVSNLHHEYHHIQSISPVEPTMDFYDMAIATQPMNSVRQWERCLVGVAYCDTLPRYAEFLCKGRVVNVEEEEWPRFALIKQENAPGIEPLQSMRLCDPRSALR